MTIILTLYSYQVVLFNDQFNKRERVLTVLQTIANLTDAEANRVMMEAHSTGRGSIPGLYYSNDDVHQCHGDDYSLTTTDEDDDEVMEQFVYNHDRYTNRQDKHNLPKSVWSGGALFGL